MNRNHNEAPQGGIAILFMALVNAVVLGEGLSHPKWYFMLYLTVPLLLVSMIGFRRKQ